MKPILEIQNISKKFRIGGDRGGYKTLRDSLFSKSAKKEDKSEFWALKDISFDVFPGDTIGIIGKNGAGKSTLLKILSRITPPTKGKIICRGRIASLLEVGTGFHGELTGRENIYLNGSILGLRKAEINNKFDEIVDFSGVETFLDTPLKHYSSGMQLRLAFAVAAHLEPEILIIDEVLAVGDAAFQKKCMSKMDDVSKSGRTILFVSHNLSQVQTLCYKGILLEQGILLLNSEINEVINKYSLGNRNKDGLHSVDLTLMPKNGPKHDGFAFQKVTIQEDKLIENQEITIEFDFVLKQNFDNLLIGFSVSNFQNITLIENRSSNTENLVKFDKKGVYKLFCKWNIDIKAGVYNLNIGARSDQGLLEYIPSAMILEVLPKIDNNFLEWNKPNNGLFLIRSKWELIE